MLTKIMLKFCYLLRGFTDVMFKPIEKTRNRIARVIVSILVLLIYIPVYAIMSLIIVVMSIFMALCAGLTFKDMREAIKSGTKKGLQKYSFK